MLRHSRASVMPRRRGLSLARLSVLEGRPLSKGAARAQGRWGEGSANPGLLTNLAYAYAALGSPAKAVRAAREAVILAPHSRLVSFNLAGYLVTIGCPDEAAKELRRLQSVLGDDDPTVAAALAHAFLAQNNVLEARKELRRAAAGGRFGRGQVDYAELAANLAFVEWRTGERDRSGFLATLREQISFTGGRSLRLAIMLSDTLNRSSACKEIEALTSAFSRIKMRRASWR